MLATPIALYPYRDAHGRLLFEVVRFEPKRFDIWDDQENLLPDFPMQLVPYRLPELFAADGSETVYIVEGEKDVETLRDRGLVATTNPGGARLGWKEAYCKYLQDRHVVILPDADNPGRSHAEKAAALIRSVATSIVTVPLPGLSGGADISDWLARGHDVTGLLEHVLKARYAVAGLSRAPNKRLKGDLILGAPLQANYKLVLFAFLHLLEGGRWFAFRLRSYPPSSASTA